MMIAWNYEGIMFFLYFSWKWFLKISPGFSDLLEMLRCHTEICLCYTKFYVLEKWISRRQQELWTAKVKEGNFSF